MKTLQSVCKCLRVCFGNRGREACYEQLRSIEWVHQFLSDKAKEMDDAKVTMEGRQQNNDPKAGTLPARATIRCLWTSL